MTHPLTLGALGAALLALGLARGGPFLLAAWLGLDFLVLADAYARNGIGIFGKGPDGRLAALPTLVFLPVHLLAQATWGLLRLGREPACDRITDDLYVGRRLLPPELTVAFDRYVDLTAEFSEPASIRASAAYRSFPILDGGVPPPGALPRLLAGLGPGRIYLHCAQGHGRTGLVAAALLLARGEAGSVEEALGRLRSVRPGIRLNRRQEAFLRDHAGDRAGPGPSPCAAPPGAAGAPGTAPGGG
jgi:hypothetical protein